MGSQDSFDLGIEGITDAVRIGQGSFGTVYRATQAAYGRTVAVKVLSAPLVDEQSRKAFDRECRALGTISDHPNIVTLYAAGISAGDRPYLIMEFLSGGSLSDVLAAGPMPWQEAVAIGIKVAGALATAHGAGVLHRDIKPENVLLSAYNEPELADFGVAKVQGGTHTTMGMITGSIAYAAPEVLSGVAATEASDVWGLACTIATLLSGVSPFHREGEQTLHPLLMRIVTGEPNDLRPFGVPEDLCDAIAAALAKDTWERTPTAVAFGEGLQQVQQRHGLPVTPMTVRRSSDPAVTALAEPAPAPGPGAPIAAAAAAAAAGGDPVAAAAAGGGPVAAAGADAIGSEPPPPLDAPEPKRPPAREPAPVASIGEEMATRRRMAPLAGVTSPPPAAVPPPAAPRTAAPPPARPAPAAAVPAAATPVGRPPAPAPSVAPAAPSVAHRADLALPPAGPEGPVGPRRSKPAWQWWAAGGTAVAVVAVVLALALGGGKSPRLRTAGPAAATVTTVRAAGTTAPATTPTTAPPIRPVFADDFSNPASGWAPDLNQAGSGTASYQPDGYHVTALKVMPALNTFSVASPYQPRLPSMTVTVAATLTGAPADGAGVRCDQGARVHLRYTFEIHGDGSWVVFKIDDSGGAALVQGQSPNVINSGARANLITGTCSEVGVGATKLTMLVNGVTLGTVTDPHPGQLAWHAGLVVYRTTPTLATQVRFNSFQTFAAAQ